MNASRCHHWVIGDVHGCHRALLELLAVLPADDHLVFCGDVINRGSRIEESMLLVWDLMRCGRATWLRGNHEQELIDALQTNKHSGSKALLRQDTCQQLGEAGCRDWLHRLNQLPLVFRGDGWSATHAGFTASGQPDLSIRESFWKTYDGRFGRVVIGHTPRPQVERHERIVLIDTGAVYGGLLSAFCPETDAVVQVLGERAQKPYPRAKDLKRVPAVLAGDPGSC